MKGKRVKQFREGLTREIKRVGAHKYAEASLAEYRQTWDKLIRKVKARLEDDSTGQP